LLAGSYAIAKADRGVDANIQRWVAQFETPDGKPLANG
jgi:hypothetical protein